MTHAKQWLAVLLTAATLMGCAGDRGRDFTYHSDNEVPSGPGLFSGENGGFTIYRKPENPPAEPAETPDEKNPSAEGGD